MLLPKTYAEHDTKTDQQNHLTSQFLYSTCYIRADTKNPADDVSVDLYIMFRMIFQSFVLTEYLMLELWKHPKKLEVFQAQVKY